MIKVDKGRVEVRGSVTEIMTDLALVIGAAVETISSDIPREAVLEMVQESYKLGIMTK